MWAILYLWTMEQEQFMAVQLMIKEILEFSLKYNLEIIARCIP